MAFSSSCAISWKEEEEEEEEGGGKKWTGNESIRNGGGGWLSNHLTFSRFFFLVSSVLMAFKSQVFHSASNLSKV